VERTEFTVGDLHLDPATRERGVARLRLAIPQCRSAFVWPPVCAVPMAVVLFAAGWCIYARIAAISATRSIKSFGRAHRSHGSRPPRWLPRHDARTTDRARRIVRRTVPSGRQRSRRHRADRIHAAPHEC
jgi:hypothetical protein